MTNRNKAFTLIELLVVIAIIGVLATLIMANFVGVRERARDAQRKNDINQIQKALELYKQNQATPQYPNDNLSLLTTAYLKAVPHDPQYNSSCTTNCWPDYSFDRDNSDVLKYTLKACLENASDPQKDGTNTCSPGYSFTRSEP